MRMPLSAFGAFHTGNRDFAPMAAVQVLWNEIQADWINAAIVGATIAFSYAAFALIGFGGGPLATPFLVLRLPVRTVVPLLAVLDVVAATINLVNLFARGGRAELRARVDFQVLKILTPTMIIGAYVGTVVLKTLPSRYILLAFGIFIFATSLRSLRAKAKPRDSWLLAIIAGLGGGVLSGAFGIGGPLFALYMSSRLDAEKVPYSLGTLIGMAATTRTLIFLYDGIYANPQLVALILVALPSQLFGMLCTHRMTRDFPRQTVIRLLRYLLLLVSISILVRAAYQFS
jgi:uncharacterized membrane protein YfcA